MSATIKYKGNTIATITTDSSKTLKTSGKYCEGDIVVENVQDGGGGSELVLSDIRLPAATICTDVIENHIVSSDWSPVVTAIDTTPISYYKDSAAEVTSGTTLTSQVACNVGDLVIAAIVVRSALTLSDGWTLIGTSTPIASDEYNQTLSWAYKYAESESESITVTQATTNRIYINMCALQGATGFTDNGFVYDTATDTTSFTITRPSGLVLWAASKPTWSTSTPYGQWKISNNSPLTALDQATTQPRLALFYDQSNDTEVTFTTPSTGLRTFGSLTIQGMTAFVE